MVDWVQDARPGDRLWLAGFSFGAYVTLAAAADPKSDVAKGIRVKLANAADYLDAAETVVRVAVDVPVNLSTGSDALPLAAADPARVADLAARYGVSSSIARLQKALDSLD